MPGLECYALMLPPNALRGAAKRARRLAHDMDSAADRKERLEKTAQRVRERRRHNSTLVQMIATYIASGQSSGQALQSVARLTGHDLDLLRACERQAIYQANRRWLRVRNRRIVQLARKGYQDKQIASIAAHPITGKTLHPKTINRIINENWKIVDRNISNF